MSERSIAEFTNIVQPILDEYKRGTTEVLNKFKKSLDENISDMSKDEQIIFATMFSRAQRELEEEM